MAKRESRIMEKEVTLADIEAQMRVYAAADARIRQLEAKRDKQFAAIRDKCAEAILPFVEEKTSAADLIQSYAVSGREKFFSEKKSMDTSHGVIGFRAGRYKLTTQKGYDWGAVLALVKRHLPGYVRVTEDVAKDKLLSDKEVAVVSALFPKCGIQAVQQAESFFIELKKESV